MLKPNYVYNLVVLNHDEVDKLKAFLNEYVSLNDNGDADIDFDRIMKHRIQDENEYRYYANCLVSIHQVLNISERDLTEEMKQQFRLEFLYLLNPTIGMINELGLINKVPTLAFTLSQTSLASNLTHVLTSDTRDKILRELAKLSKDAVLLDFSHLENDSEVLDLDTLIENEDGDGLFIWSKHAFFRHEYLNEQERLCNDLEQLYSFIDDNTLVLGIPSKNGSCSELCEVLADEFGFTVEHYFGDRLAATHLTFEGGSTHLDKKEPSLDVIFSLLDALGAWDSYCEFFKWDMDDMPNQIWHDEDSVYAPALGVE